MSDALGSVRYAADGGIAVITLDRPSRLNALTHPMLAELDQAMRHADAEDDVRVVVVTGAGRGFCAGTDLSSAAALRRVDPMGSDGLPPIPERRFEPQQVRKPVIAAVNGPAVGYGLTLALQCDIRYVADDAKLGFVFVRRGIIGELGTHWILPRLVGIERAAELLLTGRIFSGLEAVALGIASKALPAAEVLGAAMSLAEEIAVQAAPVSTAISKRLLWRAVDSRHDDADRLEAELVRWVQGQPDAVEGVRSFLEGRPPDWQLRVGRDYPGELFADE